jgi:hypothetical protein
MATDIVATTGIPATDIVVTMDILAMEAMAVTTRGDIVLTTGLIPEAIMATPMVVATTEGLREGLGLVSGSKPEEDAD